MPEYVYVVSWEKIHGNGFLFEEQVLIPGTDCRKILWKLCNEESVAASMTYD